MTSMARKRCVAHDGQPFAFGHRQKLVAVLIDERNADRLQIVAGIEPFRNRADLFAKRLAVAEIG